MLKACQARRQILQGFVKVDRKKRKIFNFARLKFILMMIKKIFITVGEYLLFMKKVFRKPEKWKIFWRQLMTESDKLIISSIILVGVISIFIGGVLVIQMASNLDNPIIDKMYIGYMVRESLVVRNRQYAHNRAGRCHGNDGSQFRRIPGAPQDCGNDIPEPSAYAFQPRTWTCRRMVGGRIHPDNPDSVIHNGNQVFL